MQLSLFVLLASSAYCVFWLYKKFFRLIYCGSKFPGPTAYPLIGNSYMFFNKNPTEYRNIMLALTDKYNENVRIWLGHRLLIVLANPEDVKTILTSDNTLTVKSYEYRYLKMAIGDGLITSDGKLWASHSKVAIPAFTNSMLESYLKIMERETKIFMKKMLKHEDDEFFDIHEEITSLSLDVITTTCMGVDMNFQSGKNKEYYEASKELNKRLAERIFDVINRYDFLYKFTKSSEEFTRSQKMTWSTCDNIILDRREKLINSDKLDRVFLDILLEARIDGIPLSNDEIRDEVLTFIEAGHSTSSVAMGYILFCIGKNPEVQQKLFEELESVIVDPDEPLTLETAKDLKYMDLVMQELQRVFPSVSSFARRAVKEFTLGGKIVPKDATIVISQFCMGKKDSLFEKPLEFIPERFIDKNFHNFAYVPFAAGQRHCLGHRFANLEIKTFLSKLLRRYEVTIKDGYEPEFVTSISLVPTNGVHLKLKRRA